MWELQVTIEIAGPDSTEGWLHSTKHNTVCRSPSGIAVIWRTTITHGSDRSAGQHLKDTRMPSLLNFSYLSFINTTTDQLFYSFIVIGWFSSQSDLLRSSVCFWSSSISTSTFEKKERKNIHFCQDEHEKHAALSREWQHWLFAQTWKNCI